MESVSRGPGSRSFGLGRVRPVLAVRCSQIAMTRSAAIEHREYAQRGVRFLACLAEEVEYFCRQFEGAVEVNVVAGSRDRGGLDVRISLLELGDVV